MTLQRIIPFPTEKRVGYARKVALNISKGSTLRDANHRLNRSVSAMRNQMNKAGIAPDEIERQVEDFLYLLHRECWQIGSKFAPHLPEAEDRGDTGGAA